MNTKWKAPNEVALVIVNYNNEVEVSDVLQEALQYFSIDQIIFVDDGSTDSSPQKARDCGLNIVSHEVNLGVGAAIRSGIWKARELGFQFVVMIASNGKMLPRQANRVITALESGADFVQGSRYASGGDSPNLTAFRRIAIPLLSFALWPVLGVRFRDVTCGYRGLRLSVLDDTRISLGQEWLNRYELESYLLYKVCRLGLEVREVPVTMKYTHLIKHRVSKIRPFRDWWIILRPFVLLNLGLRK